MLARVLPAAALALALAAPGVASALADPEAASTAARPAGLEPQTVTTAGLEPQAAATTAAREEEEENWLDIGHAFIEHRVFAPALRIDRFFSDNRDLEAERARSYLQWRQELRFQRYRGAPAYTTTITANLKVPGINEQLKRFQVEVTGQTKNAFTALFPGDHATPGEVPTSDSTFGSAEAGLGYRLFETLSSTIATHGDLGAGMLLTLPPGVYARARLRFVESLGGRFLARQAVTGFWRTDTLFGSTVSAELQRPLVYTTTARLSGSTTLTERSRGYEWGGDLSLLGTFQSRIGAQLGFGISGATRAPAPIDIYRFYVRVRRDFYRKWIFLELEPQQAWPWTPDRKRHAEWAVALRLEVQFQGNEPRMAPPPNEPPEPQEPKEPGPTGERRSALPSCPVAG